MLIDGGVLGSVADEMSQPRRIEPAMWERPSRPNVGEITPDPLYAAVGRAVSYWERFEAQLTFIYGHFTGQGAYAGDAIRAYGDGVGFHGRADILEAKAYEFFCKNPSQDREGEFTEVLTNGRQASLRRNDIAHGVVSAYSVDFETGSYAWLLTPPLYMYKRFDEHFQPVYAYSAEQVIRIAQGFDALEFAATRLFARLIDPRRRTVR